MSAPIPRPAARSDTMAAMPAPRDLRDRIVNDFRWIHDPIDGSNYADVTGWWRDPVTLRDMTCGLADLVRDDHPTVVLGLQSRGTLLGALVAQHLHVGLVEVRKGIKPSSDTDQLLTATTPPDYRDRHLKLGFRKDLISRTDRAVLIDDWIDTGGQALGVQQLVHATDASWLGAAVVVDGLSDNRIRRQLNVRSLVHLRHL